MRRKFFLFIFPFLFTFCTACVNTEAPANNSSEFVAALEEPESKPETVRNEEKLTVNSIQSGWITEQVLDGSDGEIHYSYYLPESYDGKQPCPMVVVMPGYDMMWFGEESSGANLSWRGLLAWVELDEDMIVVSAQLTDWHEKSARRAGTTAAFEQLNKYFTIQEMPVVSSRYWNMVHGVTAEQVKEDAEGLYTMRVLGRNMAYMLRCQEAARNAGVMLPEQETPVFTNFVR